MPMLRTIILLVTISVSLQFSSYLLSSTHHYRRLLYPIVQPGISPYPHRLSNHNQYGASLSLSTSLHAASKSTTMHQYQIGDEVLVINNDDGATHHIGIIEDKKGGWYTVYIPHDSNRVKRRASQLLQSNDEASKNDGDGGEVKPIPTPTSSSAGVNNNNNEEQQSETIPPVDILDLDSILQSMQHTNPPSINTTTISNQTANISYETIQQIQNCHSHTTQWLIFSDLHVMPTTLSTCLQVLNYVHTTAQTIQTTSSKRTGILFLGDFWHHRGFVRVDCLNSILDCMASWKVPSIMIPGNHDQIDWRGVDHALTPLQNAYRIPAVVSGSSGGTIRSISMHAGPLILSHPTKFQNALFVPHIRDKFTMASILQSNEALTSKALFIHADVKGASMNDLIKSQHGLDGNVFPNDEKCIYSGHFHKPHVVHVGNKQKRKNGAEVRYVGSPYQTSFSESGQAKSLLLVDSTQNWKCIQEIPIDIGPQYHRISSVHDFLEDDVTREIRKGDKVAVNVCQNELDEMRLVAQENCTDDEAVEKSLFDEKLEELRNAGVSVEIRDSVSQDQDEYDKPNSSTEDENEIELEDLSPQATLAAYLDNEVDNDELGEVTAKKILELGEELLGEASTGDDTSPSSNNEATVSELRIESVTLKGFGSFREETVYPLQNRGVVLLRGTNKDFGSDSNGVGKSTLAMASLWALAGSTDPRPAQDGKVTDVVNDFSKVAEVTLSGCINSKPFLVKRTKSISSKGSSLKFVYDGVDLTRQSSKDTQQIIDTHFSTGSQMLMRTIFHGQHSIGGLLESSDAKLKEELSYLISLEIWQQCASQSRAKQRELMRIASEFEGMLSLREKDKARAEDKSRTAEVEMKRRKSMLESEEQMLSQKKQSLSSAPNASDIEIAMEKVQTQLCNDEVHSLEEELSKVMEAGGNELESWLRIKLNRQADIESTKRATLQACQRKYDVVMTELKPAEAQLSQLRSEWNVCIRKDNAPSAASTSSPETCQTCGQPIISVTAKEHIMESIKKKLAAASARVDKIRDAVSDAKQSLTEAEIDVEANSLELQLCQKQLQKAEEERSLETDSLRQKLLTSRMVQSKLSAEYANLARKAKEVSEYNLVQSRMQANLEKLEEAFKSSVAAYKSCCAEVDMIEDNMTELNKNKGAKHNSASLYALLGETFGPKGVQAFVLRNIVQSLQYCSQTYLDELSDGSLKLRIQVGSNDSIIKQAAVRNLDGTWRVRPLSSLSGGQWRRCSLSVSLGFIDLASKRGRLRSSLLVLDEPLTHLDSAGRKSVGKLLRKMLIQDDSSGIGMKGGFGLSTILVILQEIAAEEIEECFDQIDEVIKHGGESYVVLDNNREDCV